MATVVVNDGNCELSENFTVSIMSSNPSVITSSLIREYSIADDDGEYYEITYNSMKHDTILAT